ncbi:MAG: OmpA family protein [Betaproteobacteria bacterium]|nr:OmpA family protein [Betaproteobacteria bacterium]
MNPKRILPLTLIAAAVLSACSSMPVNNSLLDEARRDYGEAQASPGVATLAAGELRQAGTSLDAANGAFAKGEEKARIDHLAYVAKQQVAIARETAAQKEAELAVASAGRERDAVRLEARTKEARLAQADAANAQRQSEAAMRSADASQRNAEASRLSAQDARMRAAAEGQAARNAMIDAQVARQQSLDAEGRAQQLEAQLRDLEAKKTERGLVITLGDVLFDTNQSQLRSGGVRSVRKLADFFSQYPQRTVMIEGFTDSVGGDSANQQLSERRADSVRTALVGMGVGSERITWRGYGEAYPIAGNDTPAGRQLNRRVEMVVSDESGRAIAPR